MEGLLAVLGTLVMFAYVSVSEEQLEKKNIEDNLNE